MDGVEFLAIAALALSAVPLFPEPYYHKRHVCFWDWLARELYEMRYGEKARLQYPGDR